MTSHRKPSKALERIARQIKDSDEFVAHIGGISGLYRKEHALQTTSRGSEVRQALRSFSKHARALQQWLKLAHQDGQSAAEHEALDRVGSLLYNAPHQAHASSKGIATWLCQAEAAAVRCVADFRSQPRQASRRAPLQAAAALHATFEHHKIKFSTQVTAAKQSAAVSLLCAIARHAGDAELTPAGARQALLQSGSRRPAAA